MNKMIIPVDSFSEHTVNLGHSGCGKSFLNKFIIPQLAAKGVCVKVFDNENEYKDLIKVVEPGRIYVLDPKNDKDNFFEPPPGVPPKEWLSKLINIFREVFYLRDGSINLLRIMLNDLFHSRGIFSGSDNYPSILDLVNLLENTKFKAGSRFSGYHESLVNRFKGLLENLGDTLYCQKGYDLTNEPGKIIIYRKGSLSDDARNLDIYLKLSKEAAYREKLPPQGLKTVFVIEEAHKLYNEKIAQRYDLGEPMIFSNSRTFRKRGIGCIYSDQVPSELPSALTGNVNNFIVFRLVNGKCIWRISQSINLKPDQSECLPILPKRQCIFQSGDYPEPVLVEIPELYFEYVTEEEVEAHMRPLLSKLKYTPVAERPSVDLSMGMTSFKAGKSKERPNRIWKKILETVAEKAPVSLREIYEECDINHFQGRKILETLIKQELIETCAVGFGARGNPKTFVVLLPKGAEFIGVDYEKVKLAGKGDTEHVILQHLLAQAMKGSGKTVSVEYHANGKSVDIAEIRDDRSIAYEIELAPSHPHVAENVRKDFAAGFSQVVVITKNKACQIEAKNRIVSEIEWEKLSKVEFKLPKDFLKKSNSPEGEDKRKPHSDLSRIFPSLSFILPFLWLIFAFFLLQQDSFGSNTNHLHGLTLPHIPAFAAGRNPDKRYAYDVNSEVVDVLLNRDLNLLCRIGKMRKKQIREREDRFFNNWRKKVIKENCLASQRKVAHLREVFKSKEVRL